MTMKAVIIKERRILAVTDIEVPALPPDRIRIRTIAVGVNTTEVHHVAGDGVGRVGGVLGCDLAGIVEEIGPACTTGVKKGDAVYAVSHSANPSNENEGAFAEYVNVKDGHVSKKPDNLRFQDVATLGVGITSVGQALHLTLGLPLPTEPSSDEPTILIYGGSTGTGTLAIQYAKLSGAKVITTASEVTRELVQSRGPDLIVDDKDPGFVDKITDYVATPKQPIRYVLDCISTESSYDLIAKTLPQEGASEVRLCALLPLDAWPRKDVKTTAILSYTTFGEPLSKFGIDFPSIPEHFEFGKKFWKLSEDYISSGKVKPHPAAVRQNGLNGIPDGIMEISKGSVRGEKLVYIVAETGEGVGSTSTTAEKVKRVELGNW